MKLAAIEAEWETRAGAAPFTVFGLPDIGARRDRTTRSRSLAAGPDRDALASTSEVPGINELVRSDRGAHPPAASTPTPRCSACSVRPRRRRRRAPHSRPPQGDLGYALLLKRYVDDPRQGDAASRSTRAAWDTMPNVAVLFWSFRIMVGARLLLHRAVRARVLLSLARGCNSHDRWLLQARAVQHAAAVDRRRARLDRRRVRPPAVGDRRRAADVPRRRRRLGRRSVLVSLVGFVVFYTRAAVVESMLMLRYDPARARRASACGQLASSTHAVAAAAHA